MNTRLFDILRKKVEALEVREATKFGELSEEDHTYNEAIYVVLDLLDDVEQAIQDGTLE